MGKTSPKPPCIIERLARWQAARPFSDECKIPRPDGTLVIALQVEGNPNETGLLVRHNLPNKKRFIDFRVEGRSFRDVKKEQKRRASVMRNRLGGHQHDLLG